MVQLKNMSCTKIIVYGGTLLKSVNAIGFLEKQSFWESVSFHCEMFSSTNFGLVLRICIVNAMIFTKKTTLIILFRISFYKLLKIINMINKAMLKKLCLVFYFNGNKKKMIKNLRKCIWACFTFSGFLRKTKLFRKCLVSPWNGWFDLI